MTKIPESAETSSEVKANLCGRYMNICIEHLVKLAIFDSPQNVNCWREEIYASHLQIFKLKKDKKFPNYKHIFNTICENHYTNILDDIIDTVIKTEPELKFKLSFMVNEDAITPIESYIMWLAKQLSTKRKINKQDCFNKFEEVGL